jgi:hypothetical protein
VATVPSVPDWIITNPPFNLACEFALRAISIARAGVALLVRSAWSEGGDRYRDLFSKHPPALIAQFAERVPMVSIERHGLRVVRVARSGTRGNAVHVDSAGHCLRRPQSSDGGK